MASRLFNPLRGILFALLLMVTGVGGTASAAVSDGVQSAVDTINSKMSPGSDKMAPVMTEANNTAIWVVWFLWGVVPMILFGALIAYGVWQAKQNETQAAWKTFMAVGIGAIMYFGVLGIFFT